MPHDMWYYTDQNGIEYTLNDNVHTFLRAVEGVDGPDVEVAGDRYPYQQGETYREDGIYAGPIDPALLLDVVHDTHTDMLTFLDTFIRNLNPFKNTGTLGALKRIKPDGTTRQLDCVLASRRPDWSGPGSLGLYLRFHGKYPFWYNPIEQEQIFGLFGPAGITFPITFPITFGADDIDDTATVQNDGDIPTWPEIVVLGPGEDPTVDNDTTGKVMEITQILDAGDYITIDMKEADVWFYDATDGSTTRINEAISADSEFWQLEPGENSIHVTMANTTSGSIEVRYYVYYLKS